MSAAAVEEVELMTGRPWELLGKSRGWWANITRAGLAPPPLALPGHRVWRCADVMRWFADLPVRPQQEQPEPGAGAAV
jgi:hypothetical protein